jgi:hypothetical protein
MKLVRMIQVYLNGTYSRVHIGKYLFDSFPIQNSQKEGDVLSALVLSFALEYHHHHHHHHHLYFHKIQYSPGCGKVNTKYGVQSTKSV